MSRYHPPLTTHRRLGRGAVLRRGNSTSYRAVTISEGEPHLIRDELGRAGQPGPRSAPGQGRPLLCLVHITDLQLADVQSPARFEFLNARFGDPRYAEIVPVQRPNEALTVHAVDATGTARAGRTSSGVNTASRITRDCCGERCVSSPPPACAFPGCPASATTRHSTRAWASRHRTWPWR